eukprot:1159883-Pelagomonas_calceolata.AAC.12
MDAVEILLLIYLAATCIVLVLLLFCWDNAVKLADHAASFCWTVLARCISTRAQRKVERWLDLLDDHVFNHSLQVSACHMHLDVQRGAADWDQQCARPLQIVSC